MKQSKPLVTVGTLGHRDHGKTTLTAAITKVLSLKRLATPLDSGTVERVNHVSYETDQHAYNQFSVEEQLSSGQLSQLQAMDGAILVVSAWDGVMPQTRQHLQLAHQMAVPSMVVYLNKVDTVDDEELLELVELEVREALVSYGFPGDAIPIVRGSALAAMESSSTDPNAFEYKSVWKLLQAMDHYIVPQGRATRHTTPQPTQEPVTGMATLPVRDVDVANEAMPEGSTLERRVFINYRRDDAAAWAGRLYDRVASHFGPNKVFMDIDTIELGEDFVDVIERELDSCAALVAVIGTNWLTATDDSGRRRLDNPQDYVRLEIATTLKREGIRVIPVLVQGAAMPHSDELPDDLALLTRRNALEVGHRRFHDDTNRLIKALEKVL